MIDILALAAMCTADVHPKTIAAIIKVESGGNPLAIHDNTSGRSYFIKNRPDAEQLLLSLLRRGNSVDTGIMQINSSNFKTYHLNYQTTFDSCKNIHAGGSVLLAAWQQAGKAGLTGQDALWHATQAYNSGRLHGAPAYSRAVWQAAKAKPVAVTEVTNHAVKTPATRASSVGFVSQWSSTAVAWAK